MAEWKEGSTTANPQPIDTNNQIDFTLTATQAATAMTLRIGLTRSGAGGRPIISVNGGSFSSAPAAPSEPSSRGVTTGNWRGNNVMFTYAISTSSLHAGANTINIEVASGSSDTDPWLGPWTVYDAIDLVATSSITNAPHVASIAVTPASTSVATNQQQTFTAVARDQFGNVTPANFVWSDIGGVVDGTGNYIAPGTGGSDTVTATANSIAGHATVSVVPTVYSAGGSYHVSVTGGVEQIAMTSGPTYTINIASLPSLTFNGPGTTLTVDFSNGDAVPAGGLSFNPSGGSNSLSVIGTSGADTVKVDATTVTFGADVPITYSNLQSITVNGGTGADTFTQLANPGGGATLTFVPTASDILNVNGGLYTIPAGSSRDRLFAGRVERRQWSRFRGSESQQPCESNCPGARRLVNRIDGPSGSGRQ